MFWSYTNISRPTYLKFVLDHDHALVLISGRDVNYVLDMLQSSLWIERLSYLQSILEYKLKKLKPGTTYHIQVNNIYFVCDSVLW